MIINFLPEDILFEIKKYFLKCEKCKKIILEKEAVCKCDMCMKHWCCDENMTRKKYLEFTLNLCEKCFEKIKKLEK